MNLLEFATSSPILAFLLACLVFSAFVAACKYIAVWLRGWPPASHEEEDFEESEE